MEEIILFIFVDLLFWGLLYSTGYIVVPILSLGRWKAKPMKIFNKNKHQENLISSENKQVYIGAYSVMFFGLLFWIAIGVFAIVIDSYVIITSGS